MDLFQSLILGLVQGATEFIPISSSGHLVLVPWLLGWGAPSLVFDTTVHWGTLVAVAAFYRRDIVVLAHAWVRSIRRWRFDAAEARLAWFILLGTAPAAAMGVIWDDFFEGLFGAPDKVAWLLLVTGLLLVLSERLSARKRGLDTLSPLDALAVGVAQGLAIAPGISRSGITIAAGLLLGLERYAAARYSFLLSMPIILGAGLSQAFKASQAGDLTGQWGPLAVGFAAAAVAGYAAIWFLLSYLRRHRLYVFAGYCWAFGALSLLAGFRG